MAVNVLKWLFKKLVCGRGWTRLAHNRDKWRAVANAIVNHKMRGEFLAS